MDQGCGAAKAILRVPTSSLCGEEDILLMESLESILQLVVKKHG